MDINTGCSFTKPKDSNRPGAALKKVNRLIWDRMTTCPNRKFLGVCPSFQCPAADQVLCTAEVAGHQWTLGVSSASMSCLSSKGLGALRT